MKKISLILFATMMAMCFATCSKDNCPDCEECPEDTTTTKPPVPVEFTVSPLEADFEWDDVGETFEVKITSETKYHVDYNEQWLTTIEEFDKFYVKILEINPEDDPRVSKLTVYNEDKDGETFTVTITQYSGPIPVGSWNISTGLENNTYLIGHAGTPEGGVTIDLVTNIPLARERIKVISPFEEGDKAWNTVELSPDGSSLIINVDPDSTTYDREVQYTLTTDWLKEPYVLTVKQTGVQFEPGTWYMSAYLNSAQITASWASPVTRRASDEALIIERFLVMEFETNEGNTYSEVDGADAYRVILLRDPVTKQYYVETMETGEVYDMGDGTTQKIIQQVTGTGGGSGTDYRYYLILNLDMVENSIDNPDYAIGNDWRLTAAQVSLATEDGTSILPSVNGSSTGTRYLNNIQFTTRTSDGNGDIGW